MPAHRILIVGAGSIGERHLRCFLATGRAEMSFVEVNPHLRTTIAERYGIGPGYARLEDAIERPLDAAVVATPTSLHVLQASVLLKRGAHVLIEKPLGVNLDGVDAMIDLAGRRKVVIAVAYVMRTHPALAAMRDALRAGRFGKPLELIAVAGQDFAVYRPAYRDTYYARRELGGGAVQDALTHVLNAGEWLVGPIERVVADGARLKISGVDVEDTVHVMARHGPVLASYALNQHQAPNEFTLTVVCESGTVRFEVHAGQWRSCERAGEPWIDHGPMVPSERDAPFLRQAHAFLDAIEGKVPPLCPLEDGIRTLRANLAILVSMDTGGWVSVK